MIPVLFACACSALQSLPARAQEPEGTVRYFLEITSLYGEFHDWEAAGSRRIVNHRVSGASLEFTHSPYPSDTTIYDANGNILLDLSGTQWVETDVLHITDDGVGTVRNIYWLVSEADDPVSLRQLLTGGTAATGPDGDVVVLADAGVSPDSYDWKLSFNPSYRVRISMGLFRK